MSQKISGHVQWFLAGGPRHGETLLVEPTETSVVFMAPAIPRGVCMYKQEYRRAAFVDAEGICYLGLYAAATREQVDTVLWSLAKSRLVIRKAMTT